MANSFNNSIIILDDFSLDIDVGLLRHGLTECPFHIASIEWQTPGNTGDTALIRDAYGSEIFNEQCAVAKQSVFKPFDASPVMGLKIASGTVGSGKISIKLR